MSQIESIFSQHPGNLPPLAVRMRPSTLAEYAGQKHLVGEDRILQKALRGGTLFSLIFWGPPGTGKTTLAKILARQANAVLYEMSAVTATVKDVRDTIAKAQNNRALGRRSILFLDEIHRFNKSQQDALLHAVEDGDLILIGATTENPSFQVISPLLSRCRILKLQSLGADDLEQLLALALQKDVQLSQYRIAIPSDDRIFMIQSAGGDARKLYNTLDIAFQFALSREPTARQIDISRSDIEAALQEKALLYDKTGEYHYDTISAFIKSVRGSDPDAAVYWLAVMLEGGEDPLFIARRLIILASEDIGNAEPQALSLAVSGFQAAHAIGLPEAAITLAQVSTFLASSPKSNASYLALRSAQQTVKEKGFQNVPLHLRNAPTEMMKQFRYGLGYEYPHDSGGFVTQNYFPADDEAHAYYRPTGNGYEKFIRQRLHSIWKERYPENE